MTGQKVYEMALSFVPELQADTSDLTTYALGWVNLAISEALPTENSIRRFENNTELLSAPVLLNLSGEIDMHEEICMNALPYGVAEHAFIDDDNDYRANKARALFIAGLNSAAKGYVTDIEDVY